MSQELNRKNKINGRNSLKIAINKAKLNVFLFSFLIVIVLCFIHFLVKGFSFYWNLYSLDKHFELTEFCPLQINDNSTVCEIRLNEEEERQLVENNQQSEKNNNTIFILLSSILVLSLLVYITVLKRNKKK